MAISLEILAPYLPYGIEVETGIDDGEHERKQLHGLTQDGYPRTRLHGLEEAASFNDMLPVLRPFSQLVTPLEDGTVPAVEVAKLALGKLVSRGDFARATCLIDGGKWHVRIPLAGSWTGRPLGVWVLPNGTAETVGALPDAAAIVDYLRSKHFALPINGRPLLEGVDFIPKTSSAAPIDKNTAL